MLDLLCMGRAAVDLYAEQIGSSLEDVNSFAKYVGGCPANIAIGSSRLGLKTGILSRVGDEAMGRYVRKTLHEEGVNTDHLHTDPSRLTALVLLGIVPPDHFPLIFYRENCADMAIEESDFSPETFQNTRSLLITGTHCSNETIFSVTCRAVELACQTGAKIILDIDYRPVLWGLTGHGAGEERYVPTETVAERLSAIIPSCDLIVGTEEEILAAGGLETIQKMTDGVIVQKRGEQGCLVYSPESNDPIQGQPFSVNILNVLGAGDAFMSGFLRGYLRDLPLSECAMLGNANGALVVTRHGCSPAMPHWSDLQYFIKHPNDLQTTERLHRRDHCILAFDHRTHFEQLQECSEDKIKKCKSLIFEAIASDPSIGIIVDDQYGDEVLQRTNNRWTARCIENPGAVPLQFLNGQEPLEILKKWPKEHCVKVLCFVTGERIQLHQLKQLYAATQQTGHSLLVELIGQQDPKNLTAVYDMMQQCYTEEIYPVWWKFPAIDQPDLWKKIEACITEHDPSCLGVLLLGANQPMDELTESLTQVKQRSKVIRGFAIGRTVWGESAQQWMRNEISDEELIQTVAQKFTTIIKTWRNSNDSYERKPKPADFFVKTDRTNDSTSTDPLSRATEK